MVEEKTDSKSTEKILALLERPEMEEAVANLAELLIAMNESGLLDLLKVLADRGVLESLMKYLMTSDFLRMADKLDKYVHVLEESGEILITEEKARTSIGGLLKAMRDPDVQVGLTKLIKLLKFLGTVKEQ
ncbi:MAG: DUF1641 domain-containing protein [Desulfurococcales archaeon]|jgi:hypothetical protein|nr:DUF1641 domain-containing protein [Desulfurococcales archaeon]